MKKRLLFLLLLLPFLGFSQIQLVFDSSNSGGLNPGQGNPENCIVFGNEMYFTSGSSSNNARIYKTDGTTSGTELIKHNTGASDNFLSLNPSWTIFDNGTNLQLAFTGDQEVSGGSNTNKLIIGQTSNSFNAVGGTGLVTQGQLQNLDDSLYFITGGTTIKERSPSGTITTLKSFAISATRLFPFNNKLYITADDGGDEGNELFVYDPTNNTTSLVADINQQLAGDFSNPNLTFGSNPKDFIEANGKLFFTADTGFNNELCAYDGSVVTVISNSIDAEDMEVLTTGANTYLVFSANISGTRRLVRANASSVNNTTASLSTSISNPEDMTAFNGYVYFSADGTNGKELFRADAINSGGTSQVMDINSTGDSYPRNFLEYENELYFSADDGLNGEELWKVDATNTPSLVGDFFSGGNFSPQPLAVLNGSLLIRGRESAVNTNRELYKYTKPTTFIGLSSSGFVQWENLANWDNGFPSATKSAIIPSGKSVFIGLFSSSSVECLNLDIEGELALNVNCSLIVNGDLQTLDEKITIESSYSSNTSGSIIVKGSTSNNTISYYRRLHSEAASSNYNWSLISSPLVDANLDDVITSGLVAINGTNRAIATYNNSFATGWEYIQTSVDASITNLINAKGYSFASSSVNLEKEIIFKGVIQTSDLPISITNGSQNAWNLVGNPYPSYLAINNNANATNNLLLDNDAVLDTNYKALYFWDSTANSGTGAYIAFNQSSGAKYVSPGQGFFVHSTLAGGNFDFKENMQSHQSSIFYRNNNLIPEINLKVSNNSIIKSTQIKYIQNTTKDLDPGYDAGLFNPQSSAFNVFTHLVNNSQGIDFMLQCVPQDYENIVIPVGIKADANTEIIFTLNSTNFPTGVKVFLEDKQTNTYTRLDLQGSKYKITTPSNVNGIGRFYLHTSTQSVLDLKDNATLENVSIYTRERNLLITNTIGKTNIKVFDVLGKEVLTTSKQSNGTLQIPVDISIKAGVYIAKIITDKGSKTKKIVIK